MSDPTPKSSSRSGAVISPSADFVASWINDTQQYEMSDQYNADRQTGAVRLVARDGTVGNVLATTGEPLAFSADGRLVLIRTPDDVRAVDTAGASRWRIAGTGYPDLDFTADFRDVITVADGRISWFTPVSAGGR